MQGATDLLLIFLLIAAVAVEWPRPPPAIGAPGARPACAVWVEEAGGVECLGAEEARRRGLHSGDRLRVDTGPGDAGLRMAPGRLAALAAPVDLNRASLAELQSLDGIGPRLAQRIAEARPFAAVDDVIRVKGIGGRRLARLRERLTVSLDE